MFIKQSVDVPENNTLKYIDLGIKEFMSTSVPAIKNFVYSNYEEAIELDSTFALAYLRSSRRDMTYNRGKIDEQAFAEKAYRYRERLPYDLQMEAMANRYMAYDEFDKAREIVEMQLEISPQNRMLNKFCMAYMVKQKIPKVILKLQKNASTLQRICTISKIWLMPR